MDVLVVSGKKQWSEFQSSLKERCGCAIMIYVCVCAVILTVSEREDSELSIIWINLQNTNDVYIHFQKEIPLVLI